MSKYRDLVIAVEKQHTTDFLARLDAALTDGWTRAHNRETIQRRANPDLELYCYDCDKRGDREAAKAYFERIDDRRLSMLRVVRPEVELPALTIDECNTVRQDFYEKVFSRVKGSDQYQIRSALIR